MRYKKCPRCELNYILIDAQFCDVCVREMAGESFNEYCIICGKELDDDDIDICKACLALEDTQSDKELEK